MNEKIYIVEKLNHQGQGIIKNQPIIFVKNALPGEKVTIQIIKEKKKFIEGIVTTYEQISENRVKPSCPYYTICGGCHIMHMNDSSQLMWKEEKVKDIIMKFGKVNTTIRKIIPSKPWHYRNKATFQVQKSIGYYKENSYELVPIHECLIVDEKINHILQLLSNYPLDGCNQIMIRVSQYHQECMIQVKGKINFDWKDLKQYANSIWENNTLLYGSSHIVERLGDYLFYISPDSFFQVNTNQAIQLYNKVLEYADLKANDVVLDLYCGTGSIGIYISKYCKKVIGVEINPSAIEDAKANKELNQISNIDFICSDVSKVVDQLKEEFQVVIVDPPRSGLDEKTIFYLKKWKVKRIVYVSCDPVTLARDLNRLKDDYIIEELTPVDMFPETYHVECVCVLKLK